MNRNAGKRVVAVNHVWRVAAQKQVLNFLCKKLERGIKSLRSSDVRAGESPDAQPHFLGESVVNVVSGYRAEQCAALPQGTFQQLEVRTQPPDVRDDLRRNQQSAHSGVPHDNRGAFGAISRSAASPTRAKKNGDTNAEAGATDAQPQTKIHTIVDWSTVVPDVGPTGAASFQQVPKHNNNKTSPWMPAPSK
jgi:hypothetical protein